MTSDFQTVRCYGFIFSLSKNWPITCLYLLNFSRGHPYIPPLLGHILWWLFIWCSLIQRFKSHCIKEGKNVDAQKWFMSTKSPLLHTNMSHFLILLILIFWPIYWSFHPISTYADSFQIILKSTQNQFKTIVNQPQIMSNQPSHLAIYQTSSINHLSVDSRHCHISQCHIITSKIIKFEP